MPPTTESEEFDQPVRPRPDRLELEADFIGLASAMNRRERMQIILERDGREGVWCGRDLEVRLVAATTEHLVPRIKGGPSWLENEVAACRRCNGERGHRTLGEWLDECERRGWQPKQDVIVRTLESLQDAIAIRGGQRRARRYIDSQLRRLRN